MIDFPSTVSHCQNGLIHGHDIQLDYAIDYLMKELADNPRNLPAAPPIQPRLLQPIR
jgi:hypothetical protein